MTMCSSATPKSLCQKTELSCKHEEGIEDVTLTSRCKIRDRKDIRPSIDASGKVLGDVQTMTGLLIPAFRQIYNHNHHTMYVACCTFSEVFSPMLPAKL